MKVVEGLKRGTTFTAHVSNKKVPHSSGHWCLSFKLLKQKLLEKPILLYPDPNKPYVLFTDASKYAWSCVLTQEYTHMINGKEVKVLHPIMYMSGFFKGSQINWACLTKEVYAIYMSVKKLLSGRCRHYPLK